ncbi:hypothetical protein K492DRAFT_176487 [Lichtheimia hyalospora FSU 10163]|nr:hypothetical protein K492DRAFT_176487 [Lichtheimia hyalospora FSU 10163]
MTCQHHINKKQQATAVSCRRTNNVISSSVGSVDNMAHNKICYLCGSTKHMSSDCPLYA